MGAHSYTVPTRHRTIDWEYKCLAFHGKIRTFATRNEMNPDVSLLQGATVHTVISN